MTTQELADAVRSLLVTLDEVMRESDTVDSAKIYAIGVFAAHLSDTIRPHVTPRA
jgi:hypothetical protein